MGGGGEGGGKGVGRAWGGGHRRFGATMLHNSGLAHGHP